MLLHRTEGGHERQIIQYVRADGMHGLYDLPSEVEDGQPITIGRPIKNGRIYVLDEERSPCLPTACGELYLGRRMRGPGYISRPDLTEAAFLPDPFFPGSACTRPATSAACAWTDATTFWEGATPRSS